MINFITLDAQDFCTKYGIEEISQGLSLYLNNLVRGRSMTPHSWEYEKEDARDVLNRWIPIMEKANSDSSFSEEFCSFDLKQVEKFGPQGGIPPIDSDEVLAVVEPLYTPSEYDDPQALAEWFPMAHEFGKKLFSGYVKRVRPKTPEQVVGYMKRRDTLTTNSGFPLFTKRFKVAPQEVRDAETLKAYDYPAVILLRYYYGKLRPVWMFPMSTNLIEAGYQVQIQQHIPLSTLGESPSSSDLNVFAYVTPWTGFEYVKAVLTNQWDSWRGRILGGDTTKMDAHMRPAQLKLVYEIVKWLFQEQYWDGLERSLMHVNDIDLLWKREDDQYTVAVGTHGLASGSCWTQLSETVLQLFMAYANGIADGQGIGDDFYWLSDMSADDLVARLNEFGLPANPAKQSVSDVDLTFLQRYYHKGFLSREALNTSSAKSGPALNQVRPDTLGAYYPTIRALGSILWPENFHSVDDDEGWSDLFCGRNYMILENCVDDPCFDEFVKFVAAGHKDMIPFAKKVVLNHQYSKRVRGRMRRLPGLWPSYNQEKLARPLHEFESIVLASSL